MKKTEDKIINASSRGFPMKTFYGNVSPQQEIRDKACIRLFPDLRNGFNNESPDFFRMDSMKENMTGYKNPYLNVVKTLDRSLFYKNNESCIDHINMLNKVKGRRDLSQNPKILKQLCFSTDINKLENRLHKESKTSPYMYKTLSSEFSNAEYGKKIKILNGEYLPNHHYLTKNSFNTKKVNENQFMNGNLNANNINNSNNNNNNNNFKNIEDGKNVETVPNGNSGVNKIESINNLNDYYNNTISANGFYKNSVFEEAKGNSTVNANEEQKKLNYNVNLNDMERAIERNHASSKNLTMSVFNTHANKASETLGDNLYDVNYNNNNLGLKQMISPKQSSVLRNINDYDIKEYTARDETRLFSFPKKEVPVYNCLLDKTIKIVPDNFTFDKWGKFHENYVMLMDQEKPFNVKSELFTEYSVKNRYLLDLIKQERKRIIAERNKRMATTIAPGNDSNGPRKNKFLSTGLKSSWNKPTSQSERIDTKEQSEKKSGFKAKFNIKSGVF